MSQYQSINYPKLVFDCYQFNANIDGQIDPDWFKNALLSEQIKIEFEPELHLEIVGNPSQIELGDWILMSKGELAGMSDRDFQKLMKTCPPPVVFTIYLGSFVYFLIDTHRFIKKVERDIAASRRWRDAAISRSSSRQIPRK